MNEAQIYQLLIGRDRRRYVITGIAGMALIVAATLIDTVAHERVLAILTGLPGFVLLFDYLRRRGREPLARRVASEPKSVITAQSAPGTPLFLRFADGYALAPNISLDEAPQIVAWLHSRNPELKIDCPNICKRQ